MKQVAMMALQKLQSLSMGYNTTGGAPVFITKFRDTLNDLKDAKEPISEVMAKSMFLAKIQDNNYRHIVDALLITSDDLEVCMQRILDKHNMMASNKLPPNKQNNNASQNNKDKNKNKGSNNNRQSNNANRQYNTSISVEQVKETPYFLEKRSFPGII